MAKSDTRKGLTAKEVSNMLHADQLQVATWFDMTTDQLREEFRKIIGMFDVQSLPDYATREYMLRRLILRQYVITRDCYCS